MKLGTGFESETKALEEEVAQEVHFDLSQDFGDLNEKEVFARWFINVGWCVGFLIAGLLIGLMPAILLFLLLYLRFQGKESWGLSLAITLPLWIGYYLLFHVLLVVPWPQSLLGELLPVFRTTYYFNLF